MRRAGQRTHDAEEGHRAVDPVELAITRGEIDDLQPRSRLVGDLGAQHRGVAQVGLPNLGPIIDLDLPEALGACRRRILA
jgi:hypothetical protein